MKASNLDQSRKSNLRMLLMFMSLQAGHTARRLPLRRTPDKEEGPGATNRSLLTRVSEPTTGTRLLRPSPMVLIRIGSITSAGHLSCSDLYSLTIFGALRISFQYTRQSRSRYPACPRTTFSPITCSAASSGVPAVTKCAGSSNPDLKSTTRNLGICFLPHRMV